MGRGSIFHRGGTLSEFSESPTLRARFLCKAGYQLNKKKQKKTPLFFDAACIVHITVGSAAAGNSFSDPFHSLDNYLLIYQFHKSMFSSIILLKEKHTRSTSSGSRTASGMSQSPPAQRQETPGGRWRQAPCAWVVRLSTLWAPPRAQAPCTLSPGPPAAFSVLLQREQRWLCLQSVS